MGNKYTGQTDVNKKDITFPLDNNANLASNYIEDEVHTVSSARATDYNILIPRYAPFFVKDLKIKYKKTVDSDIIELEEDVDYTLVLYYKGATEFVGIPVYGGIVFNDLDLDGVVWLTYRTMGGDHLADHGHVLKTLIENVWNPREKDWAYVTNSPNLYPPERHEIDWNNITTVDDLLSSMDSLTNAITESNMRVNDTIQEFLTDLNVPKFKTLMRTLESHTFTSALNKSRQLEKRIQDLEEKYLTLDARIKTKNQGG